MVTGWSEDYKKILYLILEHEEAAKQYPLRVGFAEEAAEKENRTKEQYAPW